MSDPNLLSGLETRVSRARGGPDTWNPPFCGDIDMRIGSDGTWYYLGSPIGRKPLVRLFSSVLRRDEDRFVLVTPVEKVGIRVDDAPFTAVEMTVEGDGAAQILTFRTNVDQSVVAGPEHPFRFARDQRGALKPYVRVRGGLDALVVRAVFYDLVALGVERETEEGRMFGVWSSGAFFPMAPSSEIADWT